MADRPTPATSKKPSYIPRQQLTEGLGISEKELDEIMEVIRHELEQYDLAAGLNSTKGKNFKAQLIPTLQTHFPQIFRSENGIDIRQCGWYEFMNAILISEKNKKLKVHRSSLVAIERDGRLTSETPVRSRDHTPAEDVVHVARADGSTCWEEHAKTHDIQFKCFEILNDRQAPVTMGRLKDIMARPRSDLDAVTWWKTVEWLRKEIGFEEERDRIVYMAPDGHKIPVRGDSAIRASLQDQLNHIISTQDFIAMKFVYTIEALTSCDDLGTKENGPSSGVVRKNVGEVTRHTWKSQGARRKLHTLRACRRPGPYDPPPSRPTQSCG